jgi:hypothetical protein
MTACNLRPPEGHPFHGTLVACHLAAGHREPHSWEIRRPEPWAARLVGGPAADDGRDHIWAVGPIWATLIMRRLPGPFGWTIVGGDGIPDDGYVHEPGDETYLLAEITEALSPDLPGLDWLAFYRWARPSTGAMPDRPDDSQRYWGD